jgi:hypothetical protein
MLFPGLNWVLAQSFHNHRITTRVSYEIVRSIFLARALRFR